MLLGLVWWQQERPVSCLQASVLSGHNENINSIFSDSLNVKNPNLNFLFYFFETGSYYIVLASLELIMYTRLDSNLLSVEIKAVCYHAQPHQALSFHLFIF